MYTKEQSPSCELTVPGCRPVACVLDSGASKPLVSQQFAESIGVTADGSDNCNLLASKWSINGIHCNCDIH